MSISTHPKIQSTVARLNGVVHAVEFIVRSLRKTWLSWSLARQFATCASIILLPAMTLIGLWVSGRIQESVTHSAATSAALYMENFVEPLIQELSTGQGVSDDNVAKLGRLLSETSLGQRILTFKIWMRGDIVIASSRPELVGQSFVPSAGLKQAWSGAVTAEFDHLKDLENEFERNTGIPLLEVYIPLRARGSDEIIAVGEFYEKAERLKKDLNRAKRLSWLVVAAVSLSMLAALFLIVRRGSQTIDRQHASLEQRVADLTALLNENRNLRARVQRASARASESNEGYLRRLGADLHDGPAQLISLALLRLDEPRPVEQNSAAFAVEPVALPQSDTFCVRAVLTDALKEIRHLAAGLAVPEIDGLSLERALQAVIDRHESLTGSSVAVAFDCFADPVSPALKLCAYRFIQEGLSNAFRHAGGIGQRVDVGRHGDMIVLVVSDQGVGAAKDRHGKQPGLGLRGLEDRIESLGGTLQIESYRGQGTRLTARLPIAAGADLHA